MTIAIDATKLPPTLNTIDLPSENFVMQMTGQGDAIANGGLRESPARHQGRARRLGRQAHRHRRSEIGFEGKKIWVALMDAPRVWHALELKSADSGKIVPLNWKMPFPAQWRVDSPAPAT